MKVPSEIHLEDNFHLDYNNLARANNELPRQVSIDISGIPPHLCNASTITALLHKLCNINEIVFDPITHMYTVNARTYCIDSIPRAAHLALKKHEAGHTIHHVWPIWLDPTDFTNEDDLIRFHDEASEAERLAEFTYGGSCNDIKPFDYSSDSSQYHAAGNISGCSHHSECMCRYERSDSSDDDMATSYSPDLSDREPRY